MDSKQKNRLFGFAVALGLVVGLALVGLSLASVASGGDALAGLSGDQPVDRRGMGARDAAVQIVVYFDFQCGHCERLHAIEEAELVKRYVASGKAHLEARPVPFLGPESQRAAEASLCAADQGKFWEYRDALFDTWRQRGPVAYSVAGLREVARGVGLDDQKLGECVAGGQARPELQSILDRARAEGVRAVPTLVIDGQSIQGRLPLERYVQIVEDALAK